MFDNDFFLYVLIGVMAQLVDGTLGMAYGATTSSLLLSLGISPSVASATVHASECFTTGASALSHHAFGNIDRTLFWKLLLPGILGAISGALVLSSVNGDLLKPWIALYLMALGVIILYKAFKPTPHQPARGYIPLIGFVGAFFDAIGGGGWGSIVVSNLIAQGHNIRMTIGSANSVEFFVTLSASLTFFFALGFIHLDIIAGLALGGMISAPFGAYVSKHLPVAPFMALVGLLIIALSIRTLLHSFYFSIPSQTLSIIA